MPPTMTFQTEMWHPNGRGGEGGREHEGVTTGWDPFSLSWWARALRNTIARGTCLLTLPPSLSPYLPPCLPQSTRTVASAFRSCTPPGKIVSILRSPPTNGGGPFWGWKPSSSPSSACSPIPTMKVLPTLMPLYDRFYLLCIVSPLSRVSSGFLLPHLSPSFFPFCLPRVVPLVSPCFSLLSLSRPPPLLSISPRFNGRTTGLDSRNVSG